jgi:hypothetical protein
VAAPTFLLASAGETDSTGSFTINGDTGGGADDIVIAHVLQDGTNAGTVAAGSWSGATKNLTGGAAGTMTFLGEFPVGNPTAGYQHIWIGRSISGGGPQLFGTNSAGDDVYGRFYQFQNCNTGLSVASVIENGTAGTTVNGFGTSTTCSDTGVTTLGADRLALNFVGITDDATGLAAFAGETGGDWALATAIYATATGTDGTIGLMSAAMASAGTIDGGSDAITSLPWGVVGFALIGTTVASTPGPTNPNRRRSALALHRRRM